MSLTITNMKQMENNSIDLRNRMKTSFACLQMVARHEYRRLKRARALRTLEPEETDFMADYEIWNHKPSLMTKEDFRRIVLSYFDIDL